MGEESLGDPAMEEDIEEVEGEMEVVADDGTTTKTTGGPKDVEWAKKMHEDEAVRPNRRKAFKLHQARMKRLVSVSEPFVVEHSLLTWLFCASTPTPPT